MNIHPLFVHFPIGLLVIYALCELIPLSRVRNSEFFIRFKGLLAILGALTSYLTAITGKMAQEALNPSGDFKELLETHELFALTTVAIFSVLAASYGCYFIANSPYRTMPIFSNVLWRNLEKLAHFIRETWIAPLLALAGLVTITITGGLGASMVYGPEIDPFVHFIYSLFFSV